MITSLRRDGKHTAGRRRGDVMQTDRQQAGRQAGRQTGRQDKDDAVNHFT